jgi:hypothetical protein
VIILCHILNNLLPFRFSMVAVVVPDVCFRSRCPMPAGYVPSPDSGLRAAGCVLFCNDSAASLFPLPFLVSTCGWWGGLFFFVAFFFFWFVAINT